MQIGRPAPQVGQVGQLQVGQVGVPPRQIGRPAPQVGQVGQIGMPPGLQLGRPGPQVGQIGMPPGLQLGRPGMQVGVQQIGVQVGQIGGQFGGAIGFRPPPAPEVDVDDAALIVVVLEVQPTEKNYMKKFEGKTVKLPNGQLYKIPAGQPGGPDKIKVRHKWGMAHLRKGADKSDTEVVFIRTRDGKPLPTVATRFKALEEETFKEKQPSLAVCLDWNNPNNLAKWALEHGLYDKFVTVMDKFAAIDKTSPVTAAYLKVKDDLARKPAGMGDVDGLRRKLLDGYKVLTTDTSHYVLLHDLSADESSDAKRQLDRLEQAFRCYYYWWALRGIALPVPRERQVAVLTAKKEDRARLRRHLVTSQTLADSFFAPREALPVYSPRRMDTPYTMLDGATRPLWDKGFNRDQLLLGKPKVGVPAGTPEKTAEGPRLMALLLKAMEEEWEATSTSHETSRQLLFGSGLLPRNVAVPEWVQFGMGSFFETPLQSPWASTGALNTYWLPRFQEMRTKNKLEGNPYETLKKVITDGYFRQAGKKGASEADLRKARATAWSLTYFLAQQKLPGLRAYFRELSKMPRDIDLDDKVLLTAFARAMNCTKMDPETRRLVPDETALRGLAFLWDSYMGRRDLEAASIHAEIRKAYSKMNQPPPVINPIPTPGPGPGPRPPFGGGPRPRGS
jgi:hypothetical protein